jgi:hypothetical protein
MEILRTYEIEGIILKVPLNYDEQSGKHIEDYSEFIENQLFTPCGSPIMFAGEDACEHAEEETPGGCPDCGSCRYYKRAAEHTWIGICKCDKHINNIRQNE